MTGSIVAYKRTPVEEQPDTENKQRATEYFSQKRSCTCLLQAGHYKSHCIANGKKEKGKHQVGGRTAMPGSMVERRVRCACLIVHHNHKRHCSTPEDIQRIISFFHILIVATPVLLLLIKRA